MQHDKIQVVSCIVVVEFKIFNYLSMNIA